MELMFPAECRANHLDGDFRLKILAGEDVDIGVTGMIAKMAGDGRGLDQLHQRIPNRIGHMLARLARDNSLNKE